MIMVNSTCSITHTQCWGSSEIRKSTALIALIACALCMHSVVEGYIWEQQNEQKLSTKECYVIGYFNIIVARYKHRLVTERA
jgi:hypothetical protein